MKPWSLLLCVAACLTTVPAPADTTKLSALERSQGWRLLFDGQSLGDWRGYRESRLPHNWSLSGNFLEGRAGTALVSEDEFADFELAFDWKVREGGHGEVYFHVGEDNPDPAETGPVMELSGHGPALGGVGGLVEQLRKITPQFDVWYQARIFVYGQQVEYWINGEKVQAFTLDTPEWRSAVAASRYHAFADFARLIPGRIALAGDGVFFRNIKVRAF
ncbi:MAG: DUF1080 domain-containing protein [Opitutales bacterium]